MKRFFFDGCAGRAGHQRVYARLRRAFCPRMTEASSDASHVARWRAGASAESRCGGY
jgi:hypothetical protein